MIQMDLDTGERHQVSVVVEEQDTTAAAAGGCLDCFFSPPQQMVDQDTHLMK